MVPSPPVLRHRAALYLGSISYSVYLVNEPVHKLAAGAISRLAAGDALLFTVLWLPVATLLPIAIGAWLHAKLEAPAVRWSHERQQRAAA